jgi:gamma-glutamylcyclotransferase (GGCT)/AIG2-like uncharacterized protein YtfP
MQPHQVFVYGSLRSGFNHPAYSYISQYFSLVGMGKVRGCLFDMGDYPAAKPCEREQYIVGELYQIKNVQEWDWAIAQLDDYEGLHPEGSEEPLYYRKVVTVITDAGNSEAWIYWFNGDVANKPVVESGDVIEYLRKKMGS